jgi:hypothetical protein
VDEGADYNRLITYIGRKSWPRMGPSARAPSWTTGPSRNDLRCLSCLLSLQGLSAGPAAIGRRTAELLPQAAPGHLRSLVRGVPGRGFGSREFKGPDKKNEIYRDLRNRKKYPGLTAEWSMPRDIRALGAMGWLNHTL